MEKQNTLVRSLVISRDPLFIDDTNQIRRQFNIVPCPLNTLDCVTTEALLTESLLKLIEPNKLRNEGIYDVLDFTMQYDRNLFIILAQPSIEKHCCSLIVQVNSLMEKWFSEDEIRQHSFSISRAILVNIFFNFNLKDIHLDALVYSRLLRQKVVVKKVNLLFDLINRSNNQHFNFAEWMVKVSEVFKISLMLFSPALFLTEAKEKQLKRDIIFFWLFQFEKLTQEDLLEKVPDGICPRFDLDTSTVSAAITRISTLSGYTKRKSLPRGKRR